MTNILPKQTDICRCDRVQKKCLSRAGLEPSTCKLDALQCYLHNQQGVSISPVTYVPTLLAFVLKLSDLRHIDYWKHMHRTDNNHVQAPTSQGFSNVVAQSGAWTHDHLLAGQMVYQLSCLGSWYWESISQRFLAEFNRWCTCSYLHGKFSPALPCTHTCFIYPPFTGSFWNFQIYVTDLIQEL